VKLWALLASAVAGWAAILRGETDWRRHFTLSAAGLVAALFVYLFAAFLAVALASLTYGMPHIIGVLAAMIVLALPVLAMVLSLLGTRMVLKSTIPLIEVLVPGLYWATAFLVLEGLLAAIGGPIVMLSWLIWGFGLYRLVRAAYGWNIGVAAAFATLTVVLLVAMRVALYMLSSSAGSPI
jgi:hypothetical protein